MRRENEHPAATAIAGGAQNASQGSERSTKDKATEQRAQEFVVGKIRKNPREEIRVALAEFKGHRYVDLRIVVAGDDGADRPTKSGLTLKLSAILELAEMLNRAHAKACAGGLL